MRVLTVATHSEGYFSLLERSSVRWGYQLQVLGAGREWRGLDWKLALYQEALEPLDPDEVVMCVDAFDVVFVGPAKEAQTKFLTRRVPFLCSGQRHFSEWRWVERIADKVMTDDPTFHEGRYPSVNSPYKRPCTGMMMGRAGYLRRLFAHLQAREDRKMDNDQILMTRYYLDHPDQVALDGRCAVFQNLWKSRGALLGSVSAHDPRAEVRLALIEGGPRLINIYSGARPCVLHGPRNLDLQPILGELGIAAPRITARRQLHYLRYSILHYVERVAFSLTPQWLAGGPPVDPTDRRSRPPAA